ncbi:MULTISPECIES: hypothetical protein [unclassified Rhizobium]|jgi:hypothetical protein|nr:MULTISPECIES: hypothetical protein [unclassified Rhizobium]MBB3392468.1 hypothetical protein [Rhizobium sp. BK275]MBB3408713.1 hypothetical protein [Rhizobium sp. BK316]
MPPISAHFAISLLGQSAFLRLSGAGAIVALLWLAIHWAILLP